MSFKDKLKTIKKSKKPTKQIPKISSSDLNNSSADFDSFDEFSDLTQLPTSDSNISEVLAPDDSFEDFAAQADNSKPTSANKLSKTKPSRKLNKKLNKKKSRKSNKKTKNITKKNKISKPKSDSNDSIKKILLLLTLLLLLALAAGFFFKDSLFGSSDVTPTPVTQPTAPKPVTTKSDTPVDAPDIDIDTNNEVTQESKINDADVMLLEEEIKTKLPNTDVEAAEELDLLNDESERLQKQEKDLNQLITAKEDLVKLKEQKIALLEKQIADAEAKANATE